MLVYVMKKGRAVSRKKESEPPASVALGGYEVHIGTVEALRSPDVI